MLAIQSEITGKRVKYGEIKDLFESEGFVLGGNWDYKGGYFDAVLAHEGGETFYLRIPVKVVDGALDDLEAELVFGEPLVLKHIVHTGVEEEQVQHPFLDETGVSALWNQFQPPLDPDDIIENKEKWMQKADEAIAKVMRYL
jgi:hypothetical protein